MAQKKRVFGPQQRAGTGVILTDQQVNAIRNVTSGTVKSTAKRFNVSETTVSSIWANTGRYSQVPINPRSDNEA